MRRKLEITLCLAILAILFVVAGPKLWMWMKTPLGGDMSYIERRTDCLHNLSDINHAIHRYHDEHGHFPPTFVADKAGRPMHSWRVLILPHLGHQSLYNQYRFDEPWDGVNNRQLLSKMPDVFQCPEFGHDVESKFKFCTNYLAVVGPETAFPGRETRTLEDITDGKTIILTDINYGGPLAKEPIPWMAPLDISAEDFASIYPKGWDDGVRIAQYHNHSSGIVGFADGSVYLLEKGLGYEKIRQLTTIAGGEPVDIDKN